MPTYLHEGEAESAVIYPFNCHPGMNSMAVAFVYAVSFAGDLSRGQISELRIHLHGQIVEFQQMCEIGDFSGFSFGDVSPHIFGAKDVFLGLPGFIWVVEHALDFSVDDVRGLVQFLA